MYICIYVYIYIYKYIYIYIYIYTYVKPIVVNFSSSYLPYINDIKPLFLILSTLVKIHSYLNRYYTYTYICIHSNKQNFTNISRILMKS